jgi:truncated hemoglobin YjbI
MGSSAELFQQLGGMDSVSKLAGSMLNSSMQDPRLSGLLGGVDKSAASSKVADQMCSALGGGCAAPYTNDQLSAAANKLSPAQKSAVSDNFTTALNSVTSNPAVREAVTKSLGSKMGGIVGALI